eukprot:10319487-Lingulodinium_polyedra.AAC.1
MVRRSGSVHRRCRNGPGLLALRRTWTAYSSTRWPCTMRRAITSTDTSSLNDCKERCARGSEEETFPSRLTPACGKSRE